MDIRPSTSAGTWYPAEQATLREMLTRFLENSPSLEIAGKIRGVVAPHAGYQYSGAVAGNAYAHLQGHSADVIVLLGPFHDYHPASFLTSAHRAYHTPFGAVEIHHELLEALDGELQAQFGEGLTPVERDCEHSVENQLPFLQHVVGEFHLLPIMLRTQDTHFLRGLGQSLAQILSGKKVLFVASSDLSHFYRQQKAQQLDAEILRRLEAFDPAGVLSAETEGVGYACGAGAMAAALWGTQEMGADRVTVADYATSGDVSGDYARVVGYGAAVIWQQKEGAGYATANVA